jgi:hypothetical protein
MRFVDTFRTVSVTNSEYFPKDGEVRVWSPETSLSTYETTCCQNQKKTYPKSELTHTSETSCFVWFILRRWKNAYVECVA